MVLSAISFAGQDHVDVEMTYGGKTPCQLTAICLAASGLRKTAIKNKVYKGIEIFERQCRDEWSAEKARYESDHSIWLLRYKALECAFAKEIKDGGADASALEDQLRAHLKIEPKIPPIPTRMLQDCTPDALMWHLHAVHPSVAFIVDEGGNFLNGRAAGQLTLLNSLWDSAAIPVTRKDSESFILNGVRVTVAIMIQHGAFEAFIRGRGAHARDNGFFARALMCSPVSTLGYRQEASIETPDSPHLDSFTKRIVELLNASQEARSQGSTGRRILELSPDAKVYLLNFGNYIESHLAPGGMFCEVGDAASKTAENAVRIAGLFHLFLKQEGQISQDLVRRACEIAEWHLHEFRRLFVSPPEVPLSIQDPTALDACLRRQFQQFGRSSYTRSSLQAYAPAALRKNKSRLIAAAETLINYGVMGRFQQPGSRSIYFVFFPGSPPFNPGAFGS